jgi:hypothetical protein
MPHDIPRAEDLRATVIERFGKIAAAPDQETKFPVGPERWVLEAVAFFGFNRQTG